MRKVRSAPPDGDDVWRDGWEIGYEQCLIDREREQAKAADTPRTWRIEYPPAPPAGTRVTDRGGNVRIIGEHGDIRGASGAVYTWKGALEAWGPLTEVVETEVEAAARRLREARANRPEFRYWQTEHSGDVSTVLDHVLNGGTL